ncbi:putative C6 zinc finger domain-containing protein [Rosellinia necatrix]|uniref:Putative C6 zinc finger domain-containing protein n=1 Tax=Rosellinia necatrix TaxID=77044 RepID=A0A1W2THX8_ROSNE|nr:putative C6 zinc finger domain-containing protein [Rosellinia necatrix]
MVGVPGKFKGCNTCRVRRVKCDNTKPFCKKCIDYGRECGGYERETVFIVGTQNDKGRVGSHPPRNTQQPRAAQAGATTQRATRLDLVAAEPLQPAWHETVLLKSGLDSRLVRIVAQHADLDSAINHNGSPPHTHGVVLSLLDSRPLDVTPTFREENFNLKSFCAVNLAEAGDESTSGIDEGVCLFLYQQNSSAVYTGEASWNGMSALADAIREPGPVAYQTFPAHHFFARVYRPSAIWAALLNRQPTFLCNPEWTVVPWERYPRTPLDHLLDIVVLLPSIFSRADHIIPLGASSDRQSRVRDLLDNCVNIEAQFDIWLSVVQQNNRSSYWVAEGTESASHLPFGEPLTFTSPFLCTVHIYYWTVLMCFHQCIYALLEATRGSKDDGSGPGMVSALPPGLDPRKYQPAETRRLAALVCRSLDFGLRTTTQPDLLGAPVWIVKDFYSRMRVFGRCELESLWADDFIERWEIRGREMSVWLEEKRWTEVKRFG